VAPAEDIAALRRASINLGLADNQGTRHALAFANDITATGRLNETTMAVKTDELLKSATRLPFALRLLRLVIIAAVGRGVTGAAAIAIDGGLGVLPGLGRRGGGGNGLGGGGLLCGRGLGGVAYRFRPGRRLIRGGAGQRGAVGIVNLGLAHVGGAAGLFGIIGRLAAGKQEQSNQGQAEFRKVGLHFSIASVKQ
jgi:hypothetical protein